MKRRYVRRAAAAAAGLLGLALLFVLLAPDKELNVRMLYATNGDTYDTSAYGQLRQSLLAGFEVKQGDLGKLSASQLQKYDTIYLDPAWHSAMSEEQRGRLEAYVAAGGHLFLENALASDFEPAFLGASRLVDIPAPPVTALPTAEGASLWTYPAADGNLDGVQQVLRSFADTYFRHDTNASLSRFSWGKGLIPSTAETLASMNGASLYTVNRYGQGTVFFCGTLLPSRYYMTGYDLSGGMDPALGFQRLAAEANAAKKPKPGALYFDRSQIPVEPYFSFTAAAGNALLRTEYAAFVSKLKLGYSVKKTLGPYGRPAMAHQNHFEAIEAIRDGEGIQWAELLKKYNQVPSFSLVRSAFTWGRWQETVSVHLNTGTNETPAFAGETPNSFYSSGTQLLTDGKPIQLAAYPEYRSLGEPITLPYRAYPALADLNGDGRGDLIIGSADGSIYVYPNAGAGTDAYARQQLPAGLPAPMAFGARFEARLPDGKPLKAGPHAGVAAADLNGDGRADLLISRPDGSLAAAYGQDGGTFAAPAPLLGGGQPIRGASPLAPAVGDVTGDGIPDLAVGDADGRVTLYVGARGPSGALRFSPGREQVKLPAAFAAPSIRDMNGDGRADLVVGSLEGDLRVYVQETPRADGTPVWRDNGVLQAATMNQVGNHALVGGHNAVPLWADLNGDGRDDLIVGGLAFGSPIPVDDPKFPYAPQLAAFKEYTDKHGLELYPHLFFHQYTSDAQEKREIALHRQSFARLGIPWKQTGTNQHTWRINNPDRQQTLGNEREADIWFNFGFKPPFIPADPRLSVEYNWALPFLMTDASGEPVRDRPMMLYTPAPVLRTDPSNSTKDLFEASVKLDLPIDYFEHIEYHFPTRVPELLEFVRYLDTLRTDHSYNFMTETQMARSFLNAMTTQVELRRPWLDVILDRLKRTCGFAVAPGFRIVPDTSGVPEQAAEYRGTLGLVVEPGSAYAGRTTITDAEVQDSRGGKLYLGAPRNANVRFGQAADSAVPPYSGWQLQRVNVPYTLEKAVDGAAVLHLNARGMQQFKMHSPEALAFEGSDLNVSRSEREGTYTVTHFGEAVTVKISRTANAK